jgi:hypothetical protein
MTVMKEYAILGIRCKRKAKSPAIINAIITLSAYWPTKDRLSRKGRHRAILKKLLMKVKNCDRNCWEASLYVSKKPGSCPSELGIHYNDVL